MNKLLYAKMERKIGICGFDKNVTYIFILDHFKTTPMDKVYQEFSCFNAINQYTQQKKKQHSYHHQDRLLGKISEKCQCCTRFLSS